MDVVRWVGAAFLAGYGLLALRRALRPRALDAGGTARPSTLAATLLTALALTWLNLHVYPDTVVPLGSIAQSQPGQLTWFAVGAATGSVLWFSALGRGDALLRPLFARRAAWCVRDAGMAVVRLTLAVSLMLGD
ncbi:LysE/ArgO family amino acid transporter [Nakamurella leprariae]|uniref:LysE/ArgO family amino acid transporter n=1 Tax=Nakamurella leprariae TaxID=2803911 RepID=UPI0022A7C482|nr:LysE family transporter [Nakamurella leprariae]